MATPQNNPCGNLDGIPFEEKEGSGGYEITDGVVRGTRTFFIDWDDRVDFVKALRGFASGNPLGGSQLFKEYAQSFPGFEGLEARNIKVKGLGKQTGGDIPAYPFAEVTAQYLPRDPDDGTTDAERTIATETTDFNIEFLEYGELKLAWKKTPVGEEDETVDKNLKKGKLSGTITHTIVDYESTTNRRTAILAAWGKINSAIFLEVEIGKMLYMGAQITRVISADGAKPFRITHTFLERPDAAWNLFWRDSAAPPAYEALKLVNGVDPVTTGADFSPFESSDFAGLIE